MNQELKTMTLRCLAFHVKCPEGTCCILALHELHVVLS